MFNAESITQFGEVKKPGDSRNCGERLLATYHRHINARVARLVGLRHDFLKATWKVKVVFNRALCHSFNRRYNSIDIDLMDRSLDEVISERQVTSCRFLKYKCETDMLQQRRAPRGRRDGRYNDGPRDGVRKVWLYVCTHFSIVTDSE